MLGSILRSGRTEKGKGGDETEEEDKYRFYREGEATTGVRRMMVECQTETEEEEDDDDGIMPSRDESRMVMMTCRKKNPHSNNTDGTTCLIC